MTPIYFIVCIQLSFVQFSIWRYEFYDFIKYKMYEHFFIIVGVTMKAVAFES